MGLNQMFFSYYCLFQHLHRILHSKCINFHSKCLNVHRQWMKLRRKCANYLGSTSNLALFSENQGIISATTSRDKYQLWRHHLLLQGGKGRYFFPYQGNWYLYVYLKHDRNRLWRKNRYTMWRVSRSSGKVFYPSANGYCDNVSLPRQSTTSPPLKQHTAQVFHFKLLKKGIDSLVSGLKISFNKIQNFW